MDSIKLTKSKNRYIINNSKIDKLYSNGLSHKTRYSLQVKGIAYGKVLILTVQMIERLFCAVFCFSASTFGIIERNDYVI